MANWPSFTFAPRLRGGCLPFGEARGGVFARSELPHPCHVLLSLCKGNTFSFICKTQLYPKRKTPPASWCHSSSSSWPAVKAAFLAVADEIPTSTTEAPLYGLFQVVAAEIPGDDYSVRAEQKGVGDAVHPVVAGGDFIHVEQLGEGDAQLRQGGRGLVYFPVHGDAQDDEAAVLVFLMERLDAHGFVPALVVAGHPEIEQGGLSCAYVLFQRVIQERDLAGAVHDKDGMGLAVLGLGSGAQGQGGHKGHEKGQQMFHVSKDTGNRGF